jgi:hypothetical protein
MLGKFFTSFYGDSAGNYCHYVFKKLVTGIGYNTVNTGETILTLLDIFTEGVLYILGFKV